MRKKSFYAVANGRQVGVFRSWEDCRKQVNGFPNATFKKFTSKEEAEKFISTNGGVVQREQGIDAGPLPPVFRDEISSSSHSTGPTYSLANLGKRSTKEAEGNTSNKRPNQEKANLDIDLGRFEADDQGYVVVYTDGACSNNGRKDAKAGVGVWFGNNHPLNISEPVIGRQTNNTAEINAAERAIVQAKQHGINKVHIKTDSQFTIDCVTKWMLDWKRNNWKSSTGHTVKNKEDLLKLDEAMTMMEVKWSYIAGHKGHHGNEQANRLAVLGAAKANYA